MVTDEKKIVLFDFDGVIADSFKAAYQTNKEIDGGLNEEEYRGMFSGNINEEFDKRHAVKGTQSEEGRFFVLYVPRLLTSPVFPGMHEVIEKLSEKYILVIVSSTISSPISEYLTKHNILEFFSDVLGNDIHASKKTKIKMVLEKYSIPPLHAIFITDTLGDAHEADAVGVNAIGVTWGYQRKELLVKGKFSAIVEAPGELLPAVSGYFNQ